MKCSGTLTKAPQVIVKPPATPSVTQSGPVKSLVPMPRSLAYSYCEIELLQSLLHEKWDGTKCGLIEMCWITTSSNNCRNLRTAAEASFHWSLHERFPDWPWMTSSNSCRTMRTTTGAKFQSRSLHLWCGIWERPEGNECDFHKASFPVLPTRRSHEESTAYPLHGWPM